ncbi:uncharacterized protein RJT20DRAFT_4590 [Scheffersomyces xylosifermentans]|uniref:uncharacterized protein n=1 Tax=Scheffersomyces xylosifermentans TaxID=1304137 RepID=UPI00315D29CD
MDPNSINIQEVELREQDRWLPIANVARLMKNTLPTTAKVSKDAKECMQECVSEFISFITSEASDKCLREKRKTINGEDILYSMHDLGFENYAEVLKIYLAKYREQQALRQERGETRASKRQAKQQAAAAAAAVDPEDGTGIDIDEAGNSLDYQEDPSHSTSPSRSTGEDIGEGHDSYIQNEEDENEEHYLNGENQISHTEPIQQQQEQPDVDSNSVTHVNSAIGSNNSSTSSIATPEPYFDNFNDETNETGQDQQVKVKQELDHDSSDIHQPRAEIEGVAGKDVEEYRYDDFINEEPTDELHIVSDNAGHSNIEELAKQLTHDEPDIDTLTAGITNGTANGGYF